ncbi:MAG: hypothetical protein IT373_14730 [Polyangiaceae bacterium]|nr:hypothetical protein [Polyangiaceae bacterium]
MRWSAPVLLGVAVLALGACPSRPAVYPDDDAVALAQKEWCRMLGRMELERESRPVHEVSGGWRHQAACEAARPSASADFLARVTPCYERHLREGGDAALDGQAILADCAEQILVVADPGDTSGLDLVQARCERAERCEKVPLADCLRTFAALSGGQRAGLTTMYSLAAQSEIAACLRDGACAKKGEDAARDACYAPARKRRVWFAL